MKTKSRNKGLILNSGSILLIAVFTIALLSTLVIGILEANADEIQLMTSQGYAAQALALAEAGLNVAMAQIRLDKAWRSDVPTQLQMDTWEDNWADGLKPSGAVVFGDGFYTIGFDGAKVVIMSGVESWHGYTAAIEAEVTVSDDYPHIIRIDNLKVNEYQIAEVN